MSAEEEKTLGNAAMGQKDFGAAIQHYTNAIALDPENFVLYSNRSAAYVSLEKFAEALQDGEKTISIKPDWPKGYSRKGLALYKLGKVREAIQCYEEGLQVDPSNEALQTALNEIESTASSGLNVFAQMFNNPNLWALLQTDPQLRGYLQQEDFLAMITSIQQNPQTMNLYMKDPRLMAVITKLLSSQMGGAPFGAASPPESSPVPTAPETAIYPDNASEVEEEVEEVDPLVQQALEEKNKGNQAYKAKDFDTAIAHYNKAFELNPKEMSFLSNRAAANFEAKRYAECVSDCQQAIEVGRSQYVPYEQIAKAYARIGAAYRKSGDLEKSIAAYRTAQTENSTREVAATLRAVEKEWEGKKREAYLDPQKALEAKEKGNAAFQQSNFPEAIKFYTEAIERDPANAPLYSNRAAALMKLADFGYALRDCEKCIELDPSFIKAYKRKALIQNFTKEYHKAIETYKTALLLAPDDADLAAGLRNSSFLLSKAQSDPAERETRRKRAMADPEIQKIMTNPLVDRLLRDLSPGGDQAAAMRMLESDPSLKDSFEKLLASGAIAMG